MKIFSTDSPGHGTVESGEENKGCRNLGCVLLLIVILLGTATAIGYYFLYD